MVSKLKKKKATWRKLFGFLFNGCSIWGGLLRGKKPLKSFRLGTEPLLTVCQVVRRLRPLQECSVVCVDCREPAECAIGKTMTLLS